MSRYEALREIGCDPLTAGFISLFNHIRRVPAGEIRFMHMTIGYATKDANHG